MKESTATIGDGRTDTTGLEVNAFRAVGRKSMNEAIHKNSSVSGNPHENILTQPGGRFYFFLARNPDKYTHFFFRV